MGDSITLDTFTKSDIPNGYSKDIRDIITLAVGVGWTMYLTGASDSVTLAPPVEGRKKIHLGKHRASKSTAQLRRTVLKDGDPELVAIVDEAMSKGTTVGLAKLKRVGEKGTIQRFDEPKAKDPVDLDCPRYERKEPHRPHLWFADADLKMEQPLQCTGVLRERNPVLTREQAKEVLGQASTERKAASTKVAKAAAVQKSEPASGGGPTKGAVIVSTRPMQAKATEGRAYDSESTNERIWSDGHKDYTCRHPDCTSGPDGGPYATTNRLGVRAHWQKHRTPPLRPSSTYAAETPDAAHYKPRKARVETLADVLAEAWKKFKDGEDPDFQEIATTALTWVHEQSSLGTHLASETEPMTSDEIVVRIRTLLDDGTKGTLLSETEALRSQVEDLTKEVDDITRQRDRARETLRGLAELANEDLGGEERAGA